MAKTEADLIQAVLLDLGALDATLVPADEDVARVQPYLAGIVADLSEHRVVTIVSTGAIPDEVFPDFLIVVAERVAFHFGRATDQERHDGAVARLRALSRLLRGAETPLVRSILDQLEIWGAGQAAIDAVVVAARIGPALATLNALKVTYIASEEDVTDAQQPALSRYIAAFLAPKPMGDVIAQAEAELRTLARIGRGTGRTLSVDRALRGCAWRR